MAKGTIIWDFDGTLADRPYTWSGSILAAFDSVLPGHAVKLDDIRTHTAKNFPWHTPDNDYQHRRDPEVWWTAMELMLANLAVSLGASSDVAPDIARLSRQGIVDPSKYRTFSDFEPTLSLLSDQGWSHVILSNNYPDLEAVVHGMGIGLYFTGVFTSALIGYEKPRKEIYHFVLDNISDRSNVWMVGDNEIADAFGAENAGIKAVLVRKKPKTFHRYIHDLIPLPTLLEERS